MERQLQKLNGQLTTSDSWLSAQTPATILQNQDLPTFRSLTHRNVTQEEETRMMGYKALMISALTDALKYVRLHVPFDKEMYLYFVNTCILEFPNWKPEDFFLFCNNLKTGKYKGEFNHTLDFSTLFSWLQKYDYEKLQAIEARRSTETYVESTQIERTGESVEEVLKSFYEQIRARKKQYVPEPISDEEKEVQRRFTEWRKKKSEFLVTLKDMDILKAEELRREWERSNPFE